MLALVILLLSLSQNFLCTPELTLYCIQSTYTEFLPLNPTGNVVIDPYTCKLACKTAGFALGGYTYANAYSKDGYICSCANSLQRKVDNSNCQGTSFVQQTLSCTDKFYFGCTVNNTNSSALPGTTGGATVLVGYYATVWLESNTQFGLYLINNILDGMAGDAKLGELFVTPWNPMLCVPPLESSIYTGIPTTPPANVSILGISGSNLGRSFLDQSWYDNSTEYVRTVNFAAQSPATQLWYHNARERAHAQCVRDGRLYIVIVEQPPTGIDTIIQIKFRCLTASRAKKLWIAQGSPAPLCANPPDYITTGNTGGSGGPTGPGGANICWTVGI